MDKGQAIARFTVFSTLEPADLQDLMTLIGPIKQVPRGKAVRDEGTSPPQIYLLLSGWAASTMMLRDGSRLMLKTHLPGDMMGPPSLALTHCADSIVALTEVTVTTVSLKAFGELFSNNPRLSALMFLISQEERVVLMDRLVAIGRLPAVERLAALILQLHERLLRSDPDLGLTFDLPLTYQDVADMVGISTVHVNRTLRQLRDDGLIRWGKGTVTILDRDALIERSRLPRRGIAHDPEWLPARKLEGG